MKYIELFGAIISIILMGLAIGLVWGAKRMDKKICPDCGRELFKVYKDLYYCSHDKGTFEKKDLING